MEPLSSSGLRLHHSPSREPLFRALAASPAWLNPAEIAEDLRFFWCQKFSSWVDEPSSMGNLYPMISCAKHRKNGRPVAHLAVGWGTETDMVTYPQSLWELDGFGVFDLQLNGSL